MACYVVALMRMARSGRNWWTAGLILFLAHTACAFHYFHGWSHAAAYDSTALQTSTATGLDWGGGLWANYLFAVVWAAHAIAWWRGVRLSRRAELGVQAFLGFMAFNATVVFANGPTRWIGVCCCLMLLTASRFRRSRLDTRPGDSAQ